MKNTKPEPLSFKTSGHPGVKLVGEKAIQEPLLPELLMCF